MVCSPLGGALRLLVLRAKCGVLPLRQAQGQNDGRLGDQGEKVTARTSNGKGVGVEFIHPTRPQKARTDGAPERFWLVEENRQRQEQATAKANTGILRCAQNDRRLKSPCPANK